MFPLWNRCVIFSYCVHMRYAAQLLLLHVSMRSPIPQAPWASFFLSNSTMHLTFFFFFMFCQLDDMEAKRLEELNAAASAEGADDETKARWLLYQRHLYNVNGFSVHPRQSLFFSFPFCCCDFFAFCGRRHPFFLFSLLLRTLRFIYLFLRSQGRCLPLAVWKIPVSRFCCWVALGWYHSETFFCWQQILPFVACI